MGEVGELTELSQWVSPDDAIVRFNEPAREQRAAEEISDVLIYLLRLADVLELDIGPAARAKLTDFARRFVPEDVRGSDPDRDLSASPRAVRNQFVSVLGRCGPM